MKPTDKSFVDAIRALVAGEPGSLLVASGADPADLPRVTGGRAAHRVVGSLLEVMVVGESKAQTNELIDVVAESLAKREVRVAKCPVSDWPAGPEHALRRARRVDSLLKHPLHAVSLGVLNPVTEVVRPSDGANDRAAGETAARRLVDSQDLNSAGFSAFEILEPPENRRRWLAGLVHFASDVCCSSAAMVKAVRAVSEEAGSFASAESSYTAFEALRSEIIAGPSPGGSDERALHVAELSMKVLCTMAWEVSPDSADFDRDTGWWLVRSALYGATELERQGWMTALFPETSGLW